MKLHSVTLKEACEEAKKRGFHFIYDPRIGYHEHLDDFIDNLDTGGSRKYAIFSIYLICVDDAWSEDAEIYELSY